MNNDILRFCFRGNRSYVHGPDICSSLSDYISNKIGSDQIKAVDIVCHKLVSKNLQIEIFRNRDIVDKERAVTTVSFLKNHDKYILLCKESSLDVNCRTDYPEEIIVNQCSLVLSEKKIILTDRLEFNVFQIVVAMTKALHHSIFPDATGKWIFTRLQTNRLLMNKEEYKNISLSHSHNFNYKLTKNEIYLNGNKIGYIYFSLT